jgi:hypothetical protein
MSVDLFDEAFDVGFAAVERHFLAILCVTLR